jgi:hypothetical protein
MATGSHSTAPFAQIGGRALRLGPRGRWLGAALALAIAAAAAIVLLTNGGGAAHRQAPAGSQRYGQIPSWIPKTAQPSDRIVAATTAHPVLAAVEGDTVHARLAAGSGYVTAVGPSVPSWVQNYAHNGQWTSSSVAPSTFTLTIAQPTGAIPLKAADFSILTSGGQIVHPAVTLTGGKPLPAAVRPGRPLILTLKAKLPEGEGALRWGPGGRRVLVAWIYTLELD